MTGISSLPPQHLLPLPGFLTSMRKTVPKQLHDQGVLSLQDSSFGVSNSAIASSNAFFARLQAFSGEFRISQQKTEKFSARPSQIGHVGCISFLLISNASGVPAGAKQDQQRLKSAGMRVQSQPMFPCPCVTAPLSTLYLLFLYQILRTIKARNFKFLCFSISHGTWNLAGGISISRILN